MTVANVRLPVTVEAGALGGPRNLVRIHQGTSGHEFRVSEWDIYRHEWDIGYGVRSNADLMAIKKLWLARGGQYSSFRFKDWVDYTGTTEAIGTGDGTTATFQLKKAYTDGVSTYTRTITQPVSGTLLVYVNAVQKVETTDNTVVYSTGVITFGGGDIPPNGHAVTATFEFDVPVRFADDELDIRAIEGTDGMVPRISIIEVIGE
jgi:uncharacterized protein (TIGR02217 family)